MAPDRIRKPTSTTKMRKADAPEQGPDHVHGQSGDEVCLVDIMVRGPIGHQHGGQQGGAAGEDEAVRWR